MKAVPAKAQAKGSRYQGEMEMRYSDSAKVKMEMATALQARRGLISNTCAAGTAGLAKAVHQPRQSPREVEGNQTHSASRDMVGCPK